MAKYVDGLTASKHAAAREFASPSLTLLLDKLAAILGEDDSNVDARSTMSHTST